MAMRLSTIGVGRSLALGRFLVLTSVRGRVDPRVIVRLEGLGKLKISNDFIGNRTRDLPAGSIVPEPRALSPKLCVLKYKDDGALDKSRTIMSRNIIFVSLCIIPKHKYL
jgi:hypothetical protein